MEESISEHFLKELLVTDNPVRVLVNFYRSLFGNEVTQQDYQWIGRLCKIYGEKVIFFSLLDCAEIQEINFTSFYRLVSYFAKKRLERSLTSEPSTNLDGMVKGIVADMDKRRKVKIPE